MLRYVLLTVPFIMAWASLTAVCAEVLEFIMGRPVVFIGSELQIFSFATYLSYAWGLFLSILIFRSDIFSQHPFIGGLLSCFSPMIAAWFMGMI